MNIIHTAGNLERSSFEDGSSQNLEWEDFTKLLVMFLTLFLLTSLVLKATNDTGVMLCV